MIQEKCYTSIHADKYYGCKTTELFDADRIAKARGDQWGGGDHAGTAWALRRKTPVVSSTGARFGLNLISAPGGNENGTH